MSSQSADVSKVKLWHLRLGHLPVNVLSQVSGLFPGQKCTLDSICQICPQAR